MTCRMAVPLVLGCAAKLARRAPVQFLKRRIKPPDTSETRRHRHLRHEQIRFIDQLLGEVYSPRLRNCYGRCAEIAQKKPAQMARTDAEALRQAFDAAVIKRALTDQLQSPGNAGRCSQPRRRSGRRFGTAAQTRPEPGFGGRRSGWEITDVGRFRRWRGTDGPAIDSGRGHADEEAAIEARIARQPGPVASFRIQIHIHLDRL